MKKETQHTTWHVYVVEYSRRGIFWNFSSFASSSFRPDSLTPKRPEGGRLTQEARNSLTLDGPKFADARRPDSLMPKRPEEDDDWRLRSRRRRRRKWLQGAFSKSESVSKKKALPRTHTLQPNTRYFARFLRYSLMLNTIEGPFVPVWNYKYSPFSVVKMKRRP